jgi:hypothetical protein
VVSFDTLHVRLPEPFATTKMLTQVAPEYQTPQRPRRRTVIVKAVIREGTIGNVEVPNA